MTYWRLHYHITWGTHDRQPLLAAEHENILYGVLDRKAKQMGLKIHAAGNVRDHVHVVISIPPKLSVAECVGQLKGATAFAINLMVGSDGQFYWQAGYGALSVSENALESVMNYAAGQKEHHTDRTLLQAYETMDEAD